MTSTEKQVAHPPETLEGWYQLTQVLRVDRRSWRARSGGERAEMERRARGVLASMLAPASADGEGATGSGWSAMVQLVGSSSDLMLVHFRPTLDGIAEAQAVLKSEPLFDYLDVTMSFLSVTEAGLYHVTTQVAREAAASDAGFQDPVIQERLAERVRGEQESPHVRRRLYPQLPPDMPYVCFYPMSKRRNVDQNWYALTLEERSRLMLSHGVTGRRYAGRVLQIISGAIGLDDWEWGVTLFARDPLEFKKLVTDMRFDEVSAKYAEFGEFFVGKVVGTDWVMG